MDDAAAVTIEYSKISRKWI